MEGNFKLLKCYRIFNALSLDVALGACICALFVGNIFVITISTASLVSLGVCVWLIYTFDHLTDAKRVGHVPHTFRHQFHQIHFNFISGVAVLVVLVQCLLFLYLPLGIFLSGLALLFVVVIYFLVLWSLNYQYIYHKELLIALIYCVGIFLPAFGSGSHLVSSNVLHLFFQFFLLALTNLLLFSRIEAASDRKDNYPSLALLLGDRKLTIITCLLLTLGIILSLFSFFLATSIDIKAAQITIFLMNLVLASVFLLPKSWKRMDLHRIIGDAVFLLPFGYILCF